MVPVQRFPYLSYYYQSMILCRVNLAPAGFQNCPYAAGPCGCFCLPLPIYGAHSSSTHPSRYRFSHERGAGPPADYIQCRGGVQRYPQCKTERLGGGNCNPYTIEGSGTGSDSDGLQVADGDPAVGQQPVQVPE